MQVSSQSVKAALGDTSLNQEQLAILVPAACEAAQSWVGWDIELQARSVIVNGGSTSLHLPHWPIASDPALTVFDVFTGQMIGSQAYMVDEAAGIVTRTYGRCWERGHQRYRVEYVAGYKNAPYAWTAAVADIVAGMMHGQGGMKSESDLGYSYVLSESGAAAPVSGKASGMLSKFQLR